MPQKYGILVLNGPNLGVLGIRQPEIYGYDGMEALPAMLGKVMRPEDAGRINLEFFQNNGEGPIIDRLEAARKEGMSGLVLNAGAYSHTSLAIADCLAWIGVPAVEVHLSNVYGRPEPARHKSLVAPHCLGVVAGFGIMGYALAVSYLFDYLENQAA